MCVIEAEGGSLREKASGRRWNGDPVWLRRKRVDGVPCPSAAAGPLE